MLWAERKDRIFITIEVSDCNDAKVDIGEDGRLTFKGTGGTDKAAYVTDLQLFKPVNSKARSLEVHNCFQFIHFYSGIW